MRSVLYVQYDVNNEITSDAVVDTRHTTHLNIQMSSAQSLLSWLCFKPSTSWLVPNYWQSVVPATEADLVMFSMFGHKKGPHKKHKNFFLHFLQHGNKPEILK